MLLIKLMPLSPQDGPVTCLNKLLILHDVKPQKFDTIVGLSTQSFIRTELIFSMPLCLACFSHLFLEYTNLVGQV